MKIKVIVTILLVALCSATAFSQKTFTGSTSSNWNVAGNWSPSGIPTASDDVTIPGGKTLVVNAAAACKSFTMDNSAGGSSTVTVNSGITLAITNALTFPSLTTGKTNTFNVGAGTVNCASVSMGDVSNASKAIINISTGLLNISGNATMTWTGADKEINITGTGTFRIAGTLSINAGRFNPGTAGTFDYAGNTNENIINPSTFTTNNFYPNLTISGNGTKTLASALTIADKLTINAGTLSLSYNTLIVNGATTVASGATLLDAGGGGDNILNGPVTNNGTIRYSVYNVSVFGGLFTNNGTFDNSTTNYNPMEFRGGIINHGSFTSGKGAATITTNNQVFGGSKSIRFYKVIIKENIVVTNTNTDTVFIDNDGLNGSNAASTWINAANTTLALQHGAPMTTGVFNVSATGNTVIFELYGYATATSANYYNVEKWGSGDMVFNGTYSVAGNLRAVAGAGNIRLSSSFTIGGNLILEGSGTFFFETEGSVLTVNGNVTGTGPISFYNYHSATKLIIGGDFSHTGTFTSGGGTVEYNGANQSVRNVNYYNVIFSGSGTKTLQGNLGINNLGQSSAGSLTLAAGVTLNASSYVMSALRSGATFNINGTLRTTNANGLNGLAASAISSTNTPVIAALGANSTIVYETNGAQIITGRTDYRNLTVSNPGTKTMSGPVSVASAFNFSGSTLKIGDNTLSLKGSIGSFTGTLAGGNQAVLELAATGAAINMAISQSPSTDRIFKDITLNRTNGAALQNPLDLTGTLKVLGGNFNSAGNLTLISTTATTARIDSMTCVGCSVTGNVTAQRFVAGGTGKRRWRLLGAPVNVSGSVAVSQLIDNILVTGTGGATNGFDASPSNTPSFKTYTESVPGASSNGWTFPANINATVPTGTGMCVFVRGDRNTADPFNTNAVPNDALLDYTGTVNQGTISLNLSYTNSSSTGDGFNLLANPYASQIDWAAAAGWTKTNVQNKIWMYNPATGSYGTYDAGLNQGTNSCTRYIASGQGFFVKATTANPAIIFTEKVKVSNTPSNFYRSGEIPNIIRMTLVRDSTFKDETLIYLSQEGTKSDSDEHDAFKFFNDEMNFYSRSSNGVNLTINEHPIPSDEDTIRLSVFSYSGGVKWEGSYYLEFAGMNTLDDSIALVLVDSYTGDAIDMNSFSSYYFEINSDAASMGNNRFYILVRKVPVIHTSVSGQESNNTKADLFRVYPNPFAQEVKIGFSEKLKGERVSLVITDALGKQVYAESNLDTNETKTVSLGDQLAPGVYFVQINSGKAVESKRIIKR